MACATVRLCGISTCFQVLSPGIRQVTHALLTRPPLTYVSLGFNISPFDLHVLGTPPAFILSQDQTLMFCVCLSLAGSSGLVLLSLLFSGLYLPGSGLFRPGVSAFPVSPAPGGPAAAGRVMAPFRYGSSEFSEKLLAFRGIFRVALLFICQGAFAGQGPVFMAPGAVPPLSFHQGQLN